LPLVADCQLSVISYLLSVFSAASGGWLSFVSNL
jgi:hypothetical protein